MALNPKAVTNVLRRVKSLFGSDGAQIYSGEQPLRLELFSLEKLEQHAKTLATQHEIDPHHGRDQLLPRLDENEEVLLDAYHLVTAAVQAKRRITTALACPTGETLAWMKQSPGVSPACAATRGHSGSRVS